MDAAVQGKWKQGQWPDNICSGFITYSPSSRPFEGAFILRDASHGIPVFGSVRDGEAITFNYPGQTEAITRRLVACWNALAGRSIEEVEAMARNNAEPH